LEELNLAFNPLEKFPLELLALKSLKKLSLRNCGLTSLPPELADFHWLERLDVSDNPLQESPAKKVKLQRSLPMILNF
jgi:Leucine-rich repeat (LRR) protein